MRFEPQDILDWLFAQYGKSRKPRLPAGVRKYFDQIGIGFDFVTPGGLCVRLVATVEEMGKMSSNWFPDASLVLETPRFAKAKKAKRAG